MWTKRKMNFKGVQQNIYEDIDQYQQREPPPMIAPISGVPNLKVGTINHIKFYMVIYLLKSLKLILNMKTCIREIIVIIR